MAYSNEEVDDILAPTLRSIHEGLVAGMTRNPIQAVQDIRRGAERLHNYVVAVLAEEEDE